MRKTVFAILVVLISFSPVFAQNVSPIFSNRADAILNSLNLSDIQITQVKEIEKSTLSEVRADRANIQLLNAQIKVALLPSTTSPDLIAVDKLIDQKAELRASIQKAFVASRAKLVQVMGQDAFDSSMRMHRARRASFEE